LPEFEAISIIRAVAVAARLKVFFEASVDLHEPFAPRIAVMVIENSPSIEREICRKEWHRRRSRDGEVLLQFYISGRPLSATVLQVFQPQVFVQRRPHLLPLTTAAN